MQYWINAHMYFLISIRHLGLQGLTDSIKATPVVKWGNEDSHPVAVIPPEICTPQSFTSSEECVWKQAREGLFPCLSPSTCDHEAWQLTASLLRLELLEVHVPLSFNPLLTAFHCFWVWVCTQPMFKIQRRKTEGKCHMCTLPCPPHAPDGHGSTTCLGSDPTTGDPGKRSMGLSALWGRGTKWPFTMASKLPSW